VKEIFSRKFQKKSLEKPVFSGILVISTIEHRFFEEFRFLYLQNKSQVIVGAKYRFHILITELVKFAILLDI
jgi:hypothetical protein